MPLSSCTRDQEKLNDVINQVRELSNTVDELRAEVNAIKMNSFLRPDNNPIELLALKQYEKKDRACRKSALSKFKRYFKKRKLLKQKPQSYCYREIESDVLTPLSDRCYGENEQRFSPVNRLNDQFDIETEELIGKRKKSMVTSPPKEFSESQSTSEQSTSSVGPAERNASSRTWKFNDTGDASEKDKENGRRYLKRKKSRNKRETGKNVKARFSTKDKYEPTSSSDLATSQLSDDDISTEKDSLKYQRSVTFIDRRRELPRMNAQRSQTSSVSVMSIEEPDLDFDDGDRFKESKNVRKVPIRSKIKSRIKRRTSKIFRSKKREKLIKTDCGTNCPYFKDFHIDDSTERRVSVATDTVAVPRVTEHRKTQTEIYASNGRREDVYEKKFVRQNRKARSTKIEEVRSSNLESSSSDGQGSNFKRKSCCPFKRGSPNRRQRISLNSDSDAVGSSESSDVNSKSSIDKRPTVISQNSIYTFASTDSADSGEADFGMNKRDVGSSTKKYSENIDKIRSSRTQSNSVDGPASHVSSRVVHKPNRRDLLKIGKKRTRTLLPAAKNVSDDGSSTFFEKKIENLENSKSKNIHTTYPLESHGERRVRGMEIFSKNSKNHGVTKIPNGNKTLGESFGTDAMSLSNFTSPSEGKRFDCSVDSEYGTYRTKREQIEKLKNDRRKQYDSQKYPTRINVQPYVYRASYIHENDGPFVKESLSSYPRKLSEYIHSPSAPVNIKTSDDSSYNFKNEPSENPFNDTLLLIENQPRTLLDSGLRMTEISNRLHNCLYRLDDIIA